MTIPTLSEKPIVSQVPEIKVKKSKAIVKDVTGLTFGRLLVVSRAENTKQGEAVWLCQCTCGNMTKVVGSGLRNGHTKSCGCLSRETTSKRLFKDITGKVFGKLTVIEKVGNRRKNALWLCQCDCGNTTIVQGTSLITGNTQSCGCLQKEMASKSSVRDLTGKVFGRLTIINRAGSRNRRAFWLCQCSCGQKTVVQGSALITGNTQSCGCLKNEMTGEKNHKYVGGHQYYGYELAKDSIGFAEEIRRDPDNIRAVQVRCAYCNQWFTASAKQVQCRKQTLDGRNGYGEARFYCSDNCKKSCPTFNQKKYPKGFRKASSREVNPVLRHIVLERDGYECQKCGATISDQPLHVHHVKSFTLNRILGDDPDNCVTLCKACHKKVHQVDECKYNNLKCNKE